MTSLPVLKPKFPEQNIDLIRNSMNGDLALVSDNLRNGHDINTTDANGITALIAASSAAKLDIVELLISKGANRELKDDLGYDAYHTAMFYGDLKGSIVEPFNTIMSVVKYI
jgi:ankyrin repeat protein